MKPKIRMLAFSSFNKVYQFQVPSMISKFKFMGIFLISIKSKFVHWILSYFWFAQCTQRQVIIRKKMSTECIMFKNAINISKPTTLKKGNTWKVNSINKIIWDNIILQIKIHLLYIHVDFYMKERIPLQTEKDWPLIKTS